MSAAIKAQWHIAEAMAVAPDPFAEVLHTPGIDIDLRGANEDELVDTLRELLRREENLYGAGLACAYKDGGQDCTECPHMPEAVDDPLRVLCRVGRDEVLVNRRATKLATDRHGQMEELVKSVDGALELLSDEVFDLVTGVGL